MQRRIDRAVLAAMLWAGAAWAGELEVRVTDAGGKPVQDAVVAVFAAAGRPPAGEPAPAVIDQIGEQFVPYVSAIRVGSAVSFPNRDNVRHHVYSFSEAKKFELPLYKGTPAEPVVFERPGTVVLGCNIHDWMLAYVYVLDTPWFAKTEADGAARIAGLAGGDYRVEVFHPRSRAGSVSTDVRVDAAAPATLGVELALKPEFRPPRAAAAGGREY